MKDSVDKCDHERVLNTTANLAVNLDRGLIYVGESNNIELREKLRDISEHMSDLRGIFADKCECRKKYQ